MLLGIVGLSVVQGTVLPIVLVWCKENKLTQIRSSSETVCQDSVMTLLGKNNVTYLKGTTNCPSVTLVSCLCAGRSLISTLCSGRGVSLIFWCLCREHAHGHVIFQLRPCSQIIIYIRSKRNKGEQGGGGKVRGKRKNLLDCWPDNVLFPVTRLD